MNGLEPSEFSHPPRETVNREILQALNVRVNPWTAPLVSIVYLHFVVGKQKDVAPVHTGKFPGCLQGVVNPAVNLV